jgi:hypothetical protein
MEGEKTNPGNPGIFDKNGKSMKLENYDRIDSPE